MNLPGCIVIGVSYRKRGEPWGNDDDEYTSNDSLEILDWQKKKKYSEYVELCVVSHVPAPQHALLRKLLIKLKLLRQLYVLRSQSQTRIK